MKAIVYHQYGAPDVLHLTELSIPVPKKGEILVKVVASAVTAADSRLRAARFPAGFAIIARLIFGIFKPRQNILGSCFSGTVTALGEDVTEFAVGDDVFGMTGMKMGAYAEYLVIGQHQAVIKKPTALSHADAAALVFGGTTALYFLRELMTVTTGQHIMVNGASGAVGSSALQLAKAMGATVTAVCGPKNSALVKKLGADAVIDYTVTDVKTLENQFDVVMDTVGNLKLTDIEQLLKPAGIFLQVVAGLPEMISGMSYTGRSPKKIKVVTGTASEKKADIAFLAELFIQKKLQAVIGRTLPMSEIAAAHALADSGHKVGNLVVVW